MIDMLIFTVCFSTVAAPSNVAPISSSEHKGAPLTQATKQSSESYETPLTVHPKHKQSLICDDILSLYLIPKL